MPNALARRFRVDATSDLSLALGFLQVNGIDDFDDGITPNLEESTAYDTNGFKTSEVTLQEAQPKATFFRRTNAGVFDAGQEVIRATRMQFGDAARIGLRWYDKTGGPEAYAGVFIPSWVRSATGVANLEKITVTCDLSDGTVTQIANPINSASVPVITRATPTAQTAGNIIRLDGDNFTGVTAITIGGTAVGAIGSKVFAISDDAIAFVVPAGAAGAAPIVVTNAAGASAAFAYTRGA